MHPEVKRAIESSSVAELRSLAENGNDTLKEWVAANPNCDRDLMQSLWLKSHSGINFKLMTNPACPTEIREKAKGDWCLQVGLAQNPNLSQKEMLELASADDYSVRHELAANPGCSAEILIILLEKSIPNHTGTVGLILDHPNCDLRVLNSALSIDESRGNGDTRAMVSHHPLSPIEAIGTKWGAYV